MAVFLPNLMDRADIGMVKRGSGAGFAGGNALTPGDLARHRGQKFKGDKSAERDVFRLINHAHAAAAEFLDDAGSSAR